VPKRALVAPAPRTLKCARGEASEAAAALDAVVLLGLAPAARVEPVVALLARLHAMLTRLCRPAA
jgi:hypothetical protein